MSPWGLICSFLHRNSLIFPDGIVFFPRAENLFCWTFSGLVGLRGVGAANRLLGPGWAGSVARSPPPDALPAAIGNRNNDGFCVFHCGRWSLSLSASWGPSTAGRMSQPAHYAAFSSGHYSPTAAIVSSASPVFPSSWIIGVDIVGLHLVAQAQTPQSGDLNVFFLDSVFSFKCQEANKENQPESFALRKRNEPPDTTMAPISYTKWMFFRWI